MDIRNYEFKLRKGLGLFFVNDEYIDYLRTIDKNVCENYSEKRAYIGILLEVNDKKYVAPLTSPNKEYLNHKKYRRIVHRIDNGNYGYVRIGNMIPVNENLVYPVIIAETKDEKYKDILLEQVKYFRKSEVIKEIREKANKLYFGRYDNNNYYLSDIMCNFKLLEKALDDYKYNAKQVLK